MPRILPPVAVVDTPEVSITEFAGNGSSGQSAISIARVVARGGWAEPWQTPEFDEWVVVTKGEVHIEHGHGATVKVVAGQGVYLAKGERVRWVFPEGDDGCEYVPICLPGFTPDNVHREDDPKVSPPIHDKHVCVYHMAQTHEWEKAKASETRAYYPPTYATDGFVHCTADPKYLLTIGNHFYKDTRDPNDPETPSKWTLLKMTRQSIEAKKLDLKFEPPAPVGDAKTMDDGELGNEWFPHLYAGIPTDGGVVVEQFEITRDADGSFTGIAGM